MDEPIGDTSDEQRATYRAHADVMRVLASPLRHEIVHHLVAGERTGSELVGLTGASKANVSQQVTVLRQCGLVETRRDGRSVVFRLAYPELAQACALIDKVLADQARRKTRLFEGADGTQGRT
jgi:DNA-binding transcriptional ArsR family regulator